MTVAALEKRVSRIEARNRKVEQDKSWESSLTRRGLIVFFTYISIGFYMWAIDVRQPWLNAVIPSLGFTLSTLTLPFIKNVWIDLQKNLESKND